MSTETIPALRYEDLHQRSRIDLRDEVHQLREINQEQHRMIRQLEGQSLRRESVAETRAELIRNLRVTLGLDSDMNDEEEQL